MEAFKTTEPLQKTADFVVNTGFYNNIIQNDYSCSRLYQKLPAILEHNDCKINLLLKHDQLKVPTFIVSFLNIEPSGKLKIVNISWDGLNIRPHYM